MTRGASETTVSQEGLLEANDLYVPRGSATDGTDPVVVTPEQAGWSYANLRVIDLEAGARRELSTGECELAVLPVAGGEVIVEVGGARHVLPARGSVFERVSGFVYAGRDTELAISAPAGATVALPGARARRRIDPYAVTAAQVPVEIRGAGTATRQLNNFLAPGMFEADRLTAVEVVTPRGNWSSYPPHKHDVEQSAPNGSGHPYTEAELEEIYYFRISHTDGFGLHRTYDLEQGWDVTVAVQTDDVFLVPRGYHGPCVAAPEYDMYYLNVLAGPGKHRSLAFSDDPRYAFVRSAWTTQTTDPRVPLYGV